MASTDDIPSPFERLTLDADGNGRLTAADLGEHLSGLFFLPGDALIWLASHVPPIADLLGISADDYGGLLSAFVSSCGWIAIFIGSSIAYQGLLDLDRRVTMGTQRLLATLALRVRIARTLLAQRWRALRTARLAANRVDFPGEIDLSATQLDALRLHAELGPGYALSVSETAGALGTRKRATQDLLDGLKELGLLNRTLAGGADGDSAYTLSAAGKALLLFRQLSGNPRPTESHR